LEHQLNERLAISGIEAVETRSTNGQILYLLDQALKKSGRASKSKNVENQKG